MSELLISIISITFEVLCCKIFFDTFAKKRYETWIQMLQLIGLMIVIYGVSSVWSKVTLVKLAMIITIFTLFGIWMYLLSFKQAFVLVVLYYAILLATDYLAYSINTRLYTGDRLIAGDYSVQVRLLAILGKVLLFLCVLIVKRIYGKKFTELLSNFGWIRFLFFPIFSTVVVMAMLKAFPHVDNNLQANVLVVIAVGLMVMNLFVYYLISDIVSSAAERNETRMMNQQVKNQAAAYEAVIDSFDRQKSKTHEYRNQLLCLSSMLDQKSYEKAENYVKELCGRLDNERPYFDTNNPVADVVINSKYMEARKKGVCVILVSFADFSKIPLSDEDMVTVFSNIMDNAIEGALQSEDKMIWWKFVDLGAQIMITIDNTCMKSLRCENGEILASHKEHAKEHGVGIKNVMRILDKYNCNYMFFAKDGRFRVSFVFNLNEK